MDRRGRFARCRPWTSRSTCRGRRSSRGRVCLDCQHIGQATRTTAPSSRPDHRRCASSRPDAAHLVFPIRPHGVGDSIRGGSRKPSSTGRPWTDGGRRSRGLVSNVRRPPLSFRRHRRGSDWRHGGRRVPRLRPSHPARIGRAGLRRRREGGATIEFQTGHSTTDDPSVPGNGCCANARRASPTPHEPDAAPSGARGLTIRRTLSAAAGAPA